jgi:hypothetical protein
MCVHESLLEARKWELQSVTSINLCASLNTHKIMDLLEVTSVWWIHTNILKAHAASVTVTPVSESSWDHILGDHSLYLHCHENLKSL